MAVIQQLIVDEFGVHVSKKGGRLEVVRLGEGTYSERLLQRAPLMHLESVLVAGRGISLSADAIEACCTEGIPIHFVTSRGQPYAGLYAAGLTGTVQTRRAQLAAFDDERGMVFSLAMAGAKIHNQAALLRYLGRNRRGSDPELADRLEVSAGEVQAHVAELDEIDGDCVDDVRLQVLAAEGRAASRYWSALGTIVPEAYGWPGRERRGAKDPINAALNYGYGILYGQVERAIVLAGLDPYGGFTHVDRPGKPSLVLDLIEPFRVPAVDRVVMGLANRQFQIERDERGMLVKETRQRLAEKVLARLEKPERYEGKRFALRAILQQEARHLATFLRGERARYDGFTVSW